MTATCPTNWSETPLRYLCRLNPTVSFDGLSDDDEVTYLPMDRVKSGYFIPNTTSLTKYAASYNAFENGDIILAKVTPCFENGNIAIADNLANGRGFGSSELFVVRPTGVHPRFLFYYFQALAFKQEGEASMTGAGGLKRVSPDLLRQHRLCHPHQSAQEHIANYLDRETARIDALVAEKERMLALLEEKRAALISRAVTRGLNPNAPLKPSGLDWLGDIPEHWETRRIKHVAHSIDQGASPVASNTPAESDELGILKLSAIKKGIFVPQENKALKGSTDEDQCYALKKGDVLITRGNTPQLVADVAYVPEDYPNLLIPDLVYRLRVDTDSIDPLYLASFLITENARVVIRRDARGSSGSMVKVSQGHVLDWRTPLPPREEQTEIVEKIVDQNAQHQRMHSELLHSINLLKERRSALITAAVTGQIPLEDMAA